MVDNSINALYAPPRTQVADVDEYNGTATFPIFSTWRIFWLSWASFGLFPCYWVYKHWQYIQHAQQRAIIPLLRGVFMPFFTHSLLEEIRRSCAPPTRSAYRAIGLTLLILSPLLASLALAVLAPRTMLWGLYVSYSLRATLKGLVVPASLTAVQNDINHYMRRTYPLARPLRWTAGQTVCLAFGALCWLATLVSLALLAHLLPTLGAMQFEP